VAAEDVHVVASVSVGNRVSRPDLSSPAIGPDGSVHVATGGWPHAQAEGSGALL